jgi:HEAT repeat protein
MIGETGDLKITDKICKLLISKCNDKLTFQNKTEALKIYVSFHGLDAMRYMLKAAAHPYKKYRNSAINMTSLIKDNTVVKNWIDYFPKAISEAKPEIITMLGDRRDQQALPLITGSLSDQDPAVRTAAAEAVTKLSGKGSVPQLIDYLMKNSSSDDQAAAVAALKSVSGNSEIAQLKPALKDGSVGVKISVIELMAWNKSHEYFNEILPFASSADEKIKAAAMKALVSLAGPEDQKELIRLISENNNPAYLTDLQAALAAAANKTSDTEKRSDFILEAMSGTSGKEKLIPVLAKTGGREALAVFLKEFENGTSDMREVCF